MKATEYKAKATRKILIYGPPKCGKTVLAASLAAGKRLKWLDLEDGFKSVISSPLIKPEWLENIEYYPLPDTQIFPIACRTLLKLVKGKPGSICHKHGVWDCAICKKDEAPSTLLDMGSFTNDDVLVIDSTSQLAASAMNDIQSKIILADQFDKKPEWDDYFNQGRIMDRIFSILQQAPCNMVAISHEQMVEMEDGSKRLVPIGGTSQFSKTFAKYFDDVVYCEVMNRKHRVYSSTVGKPGALAGSRAGKELEKFENPSLLELFK